MSLTHSQRYIALAMMRDDHIGAFTLCELLNGQHDNEILVLSLEAEKLRREAQALIDAHRR